MMDKDPTSIFAEHIRKSALNYFPLLQPESIHVELLQREERATAVLYRFRVSDSSRVRSVFVKVPDLASPKAPAKGTIYEKPLLYPKTNVQERHWLQYTALKTIFDYFTSLNRDSLGAIRVLDYLPQYHAIFTEESQDPKLRKLFLQNNRLYSVLTTDKLPTAFQNVGIWLRVYHTMPKKEDVKVRNSKRDDYLEAIRNLTEFLGKSLRDRPFFQKIAAGIMSRARDVLPESLPLGLGHGDYAMRNILIGSNARVTVLDTFAKWRTPIYEDIGYFLNDLKMSSPQVISQGLAFSTDRLTEYECAFLTGYFDKQSIPYDPIRLYEMLALLDKWSSVVAKSFQQKKLMNIASQLKMILINQYFKKRTERLLAEIAKDSEVGLIFRSRKNSQRSW
jgi:hypothetical protein